MLIFDITLAIHPNMPVWPKDPPPVFETIQTIEKDGNQTSILHINSHTGTHIDAPKHFVKGTKGIDEIPLETLVGPATVLEIKTDGRQITAADLARHALPERLLLKTENSHRALLQNQEFQKDFIGLTEDTADLLVQKGVKLIGVDYLSCENPEVSPEWNVHKKLLKAGIVIVESCDLSKIQPGAYQMIVLPLKLQGLDGSPARALLLTS